VAIFSLITQCHDSSIIPPIRCNASNVAQAAGTLQSLILENLVNCEREGFLLQAAPRQGGGNAIGFVF
jgi:hypothetical protein